MLKTTILQYHNVDIAYPKLIGVLKRNAVGFRPKKAKTFEGDELETFLTQMDDLHYLAAKVIVVFGIYGATRTCELVNLRMTDVQPKGDIFVVKIPASKTDVDRTFNIEGFYVNIVRKYRDLRPEKTPHDRFFINYQLGKCTVQPIGKHKFESTPKLVASMLELNNADEYTGHSFRRSGATLAAEGGVDFLALKRHIGWKSSAVAEGYINDSAQNRRKMAKIITSALTATSSGATSSETTGIAPKTMVISSQMSTTSVVTGGGEQFDLSGNESAADTSVSTESNAMYSKANDLAVSSMKGINMDNCSNFTINFNFGSKQ